MNYTSIEQSKHLLKLGLSPESADACYDVGYGQTKAHIECENFISYFTNDEYPELKDRYIPCWSLGALIELMPKIISVPVDERSAYFYSLEWQFANDNSLRYIATNRGKCLIDIYSDHDTRNKSLIETAFEMVCWLLKNGYIKKGE